MTLPEVVRRAEGAHELRLQPRLDTIEDMDLPPAHARCASRQETDRTRAGNQHCVRFPVRALAHRNDLLQCLRDHRHRLEKHAEDSKGRIHLNGVLGLDTPTLRHEAVDLFDSTLGVMTVAAHVPFAHGAIWAGNGIRTADNADHQVALFK